MGVDIEERRAFTRQRKAAAQGGKELDYNQLTLKEMLFDRGCKKTVWCVLRGYLCELPRMSTAQLCAIDGEVDLASLWSPLAECEARRGALMAKLGALEAQAAVAPMEEV